MRPCAWILYPALALSTASAATAATDLVPVPLPASTATAPANWSQWQGRVLLGTAPSGAGRLGTASLRGALGTASVMGDYYFGRAWVPDGQLGGFRATSGLMTGQRAAFALGDAARVDGSAWNVARRALPVTSTPTGLETPGTDGSTTVPYLGLGYTGLSTRGGFSYSADLGIAGSAMRLGRPPGAGVNLDDAVRDLRMAPLVQVGVSYAF